MTPQEALGILGLVGTPNLAEIERAFRMKQSDLDGNSIDTSIHKLKVRRLNLAEAHSLLTRLTISGADITGSTAIIGSVTGTAAGSHQPFQVPGGLSATKLADLPGAYSFQTALGTGGNMKQIASLQPGHILANRFEIKAQIGAGGMGAVYRAHDRNRGEDIAVKVMLPGLIASDTAKQRFINEAKISIKLSHQNIVNVYDVQIDGAYLFITMELLEGHTLRQAMEDKKKQRQSWGKTDVLAIVSALCEALTYAHRHTIHRDIKPENVWINHDGSIKLMDFGIARLMTDSQMTQASAVMGTAYYMAPEQLIGSKHIDHRADQYSVGVMLYELFTERLPTGRFKPVSEMRDDLSQELSDTVDQALEGHPEDRYLDMAELAQALQESGQKSKRGKRGAKNTARTTITRPVKNSANLGNPFKNAYSYLANALKLKPIKWVGAGLTIIILAWLSYPYINIKYLEHEAAVATAKDKVLALRQAADNELKKSNYEAAAKLYIPLAEQGEASAQANLGWLFKNGKGVSQNYYEAIKWYRLASDQGESTAQNNLGLVYLNDVQDKQEAVKWYRLSAAQGNADAQTNLESMNNAGAGTPQNNQQVVLLYKISAVLAALAGIVFAVKVVKGKSRNAVVEGDANSLVVRGTDLEVDSAANTNIEKDTPRPWAAKIIQRLNPKSVIGYGLCFVVLVWLTYPYIHIKYVEHVATVAAAKVEINKQRALAFQAADNELNNSNYEVAAKRYAVLAEQGEAVAQTNLGWMYSQGKGVPKDINEAIKLFQLAADQDEPTAQNNLGLLHEKGEGVPQDYKLALEWYQKSALQGNALAGQSLGNLYFKGNGTPQDYNQASKWYRMAADKGDILGQFQLGGMYFRGLGVQQDKHEAVKWYRLAASQGYSSAQLILGAMYQKGDGVPQNIQEALKWYRLAAAQGNTEAIASLKKLEPKKAKPQPGQENTQEEPPKSDDFLDQIKNNVIKFLGGK